ncbi:MAG TPA: ABC transporter substrate-binding protein [Anaerolineae bacterium]|nr:ABC transporter substrate-binding protein [Anaerolineae bacterium]
MFRKSSIWQPATGILLVLMVVLSACGPTPMPQTIVQTVEVEVDKVVEVVVTKEVEKEVVVEVTVAPPSGYSEAPGLADLVAKGELPPVEERLPENPMVVLPIDSVGKYGGTWYRGWRGINDFHCFGRLIYDPVLRWPRNPDDDIQPGLAESWEWSDGGKTLTLYLREGLKWSDGQPFTVDDIIFWWDAIETDENVTTAPHAEWIVGGEPMALEKVDDTTIQLKFAAANGLAETVGLAFHGNQWPLGFERFGFFAPKHYLEQFHPKYNTAATYQDFEAKAWEYNPERPCMTAWCISEWEDGADHMIARRNPYYWKVDVEGQQLPYIDELYFYLVEDNTAINTLALAGKLDMQHRGIQLSQYPVYQEQGEAGNYHVFLWPQAQASGLTFFPNQSYKDPKYRELLQNFKFRQVLSQAIDRDTINEILWLGTGRPMTISVVKDSALYQPDIENVYGDFDPDLAKSLLDEIGLPVGADGMRTFPDGSPLQLVIESSYTSGSLYDGIEMVAEWWRAIGLDTRVETMSRDVYWPKACANEVMISTWTTDRGLVPMVDPIYQFPFDERSWMAPAYGIWYKTGGTDGEEPNAELKALMDLYDQYRATVDPAEQLKLAKQIVRETTTSLNVIQTCGESPAPVVVKNYFHNVGENHTSDWIIMTPGTQDPSHYWMDPQ